MKDPMDYIMGGLVLSVALVIIMLPFMIWADFYLENKRLDILADNGCSEIQVNSKE